MNKVVRVKREGVTIGFYREDHGVFVARQESSTQVFKSSGGAERWINAKYDERQKLLGGK